MWSHPPPLFPVISVGPFMKWGIDYMTCNPSSAGGHKYVIVAVDYFTKCVEEMPTFKADGETVAFFMFNQIIARFGIPKVIVTDHGSQHDDETDHYARIQTRTFIFILSTSKRSG